MSVGNSVRPGNPLSSVAVSAPRSIAKPRWRMAPGSESPVQNPPSTAAANLVAMFPEIRLPGESQASARLGPKQRLKHTPAWLLSLTLHLAATLLLAAWTLTPPPIGDTLVISAQHADSNTAANLPLAELHTLTFELALPSAPVDAPPGTATDAAQFSASLSPLDVVLADVDFSTASEALEINAHLLGGGAAADSVATTGQGAQFFGVHARGNSFVFVVDSSNSMRGGKLAAAKEELLYAIRRLSSEQFFYVIFFNNYSVPMVLSDTREAEPRPLPATAENIVRLERWVAGVEVDPWTDPSEAMRHAVRLQPDAIYLLSDGEFTDRGATSRYLAGDNVVREPGQPRRPKVLIHTVGFYERGGERALRKIAQTYGGNYRFVPRPKGLQKPL